MRREGRRVRRLPTTLAGRSLAAVFFVVGKARAKRNKSLHPRGAVVPALIYRRGSPQTTGVAWLDDAGTDRVVVRLSRSVGLPPPLPDIFGLAWRTPIGAGHGDVLLASTGTGPVGRFLLRPARKPHAVTYSALFPYRTAAGPVLIAAFPTDKEQQHYRLAWSRLTGDWVSFGELVLPEAPGQEPDEAIALDPILNVIPCLEPYEWSRLLRSFSYAAARRARGNPAATST